MPPAVPRTTPFKSFAELLAACRERYVRQLSATLEASAARIDAELGAQRKATSELAASLQWLEAQYQLRALARDLPARFASAFEAAYRRRTESSTLPDDGADEGECLLPAFQLFAPGSVEISPETQALSTPLEARCAAVLGRLRPRVALLLGREELDASADPFGPAAVCEALLDACSSLGGALENRARIVRMLATDLAAALPELLFQADALLIDPSRDGEADPPLRPGGRPAPGTSAAQGAPAAPPRSDRRDAALPDALAEARLGAGALQYGGRSFALEHGPHAPANQIRALLGAGLGKVVAEADRIVLDVVATLFEHLFNSISLPPAIKSLIGRLQLPMLQLALNDHDFFAERDHPARRLLNLLALAGATWDGELTPDSSLYREASALIERIERERNASPALFAACHDALESWLSRQERDADERAATLTGRLEERERQQLARRAADQELAPLVTDASLPDSLRTFLDTAWPEILTRAWLDGGPDAPAWRHARALLQDLVWSVRPKHSAEERERLARLLDPLLRGLREALPPDSTQATARDAFLGELARLHAAAVRTGMAVAPVPQVPAAERRLAYQGDAAPEPESDTSLELGLLARGDWLELRETDGAVRRVRLTWISPARTLYLFANRQGQRAVALTRDELARRFATGEATRADHNAVLDRIVDDALERHENRS
ncbi:DUF1631 domain-containing protein [Pseudothauera nasutitermitis]|uniref:DUF1631 domain-containing protein n=1 Tax=Pseudothauera nasutitermitis TaxID=2565930 RepID=A0A4S4AT22_9RHOO|nr:DUF1631 family protein [Pseudothauera nasutitermitis]THF62910.1 DUF1631 domain-containing protein [Pseudothauera nasutitermitis]